MLLEQIDQILTAKLVILQGLWGFHYHFTDTSLTMLAYGKKSPVHHMTKISFKAWFSRPAIFFAAEVTVKPTALNSPPPLLRWFYRQKKNHTAIHCIGVYNVMLFTDGCHVLSENGTRSSSNRKSICGGQCCYCGRSPQIHSCVVNTAFWSAFSIQTQSPLRISSVVGIDKRPSSQW